MDAKGRAWLVKCAAAAIVAGAQLAAAQPSGERWAIANEYPANSLTAEGDAHFAALVAQKTRGRLAIEPMPDGKLGFKSREQLRAVAEDKVAMADTFGGALGDEEPLLALSSLPFVAADVAQARKLYDAARPAYEAAFLRHGQKLLYAQPWPPSGLWTRSQATTVAAVARLKVRTYDRTGIDVFTRLGATASVVSFADLPAKLASGEIDAVLSSGDGGAGRKLWEHLPHFTAINYAIPLSFTTVNLARWMKLDAATRKAVQAAAAETEARQWGELDARLFQNYARMRRNDMAIHQADTMDPDLMPALRKAAAGAIDEWARKAGPEAKALLDRR